MYPNRPRYDMGMSAAGNIEMSVQASSYAYSRPRVDGLNIDQYTHVEIALFLDDEWALPSDFGVEGFDKFFGPRQKVGGSTVAAYVPQDVLADLRAAIMERVTV